MNAFYPSCEQLANPELRGKPVIVVMSPEPEGKLTRGAVASCSYEARANGVHSGMSYRKAKELCPSGVFLRTNFELYESYSAMVMKTLSKFADKLELASIDEAYIDASLKAKSQFSSPEEFGLTIKETVKKEVGLTCSVGVAPTKASAKLASDVRKPDGLTVFRPDGLKEAISGFPVERVAGIGPKTQAVLNQMGIYTLGDLGSKPPQVLMERFGKNGVWMWKVANGSDDDEVIADDEYKSISTEHTLAHETTDTTELEKELVAMTDELCSRLLQLELLYKTIGIKVVYSDFKIITRGKTLRYFTDDCSFIQPAIRELLTKIEMRPVRKVGLRLSTLQHATQHQRRIEDWINQIQHT